MECDGRSIDVNGRAAQPCFGPGVDSARLTKGAGTKWFEDAPRRHRTLEKN